MFHKILPSLGNSVSLLILSSMLARSAIGTTESQDRFIDDRYIFEGRVVGVRLVSELDGTRILEYQFLVDRHYATLALKNVIGMNDIDRKADRKIMLFKAKAKASVDDTRLTEEHWREELEKGLPPGVQLGGPCLVVAGYGEGSGKYIKTILPATEVNRQAFLKEHQEYCLRYRRFYQTHSIATSSWTSHSRLLGKIHRDILHILDEREGHNAQTIEQLEAKLTEDLKALYADSLALKKKIKIAAAELARQIQASNDPMFKEIFQEMITSLDRAIEIIDGERQKKLDFNKDMLGIHVPEVKKYQELINQTNPDILPGSDAP